MIDTRRLRSICRVSLPQSYTVRAKTGMGERCFAALSAALMAAATTAQADCPTRADLRAGIWVEYQQGHHSEFVLTGANLVAETAYAPLEQPETFELSAGMHVLRSYRMSDGEMDAATLKEYRYDLPEGGFPDPTEAGPHEIPVTIVESYRDANSDIQETSEKYSYKIEFGEASERRIGKCRYEVQELATLFDTEAEGEIVIYMDLLPDLGIAVMTGYGSEDQPWATSFEALSISKNKPD